MSEVVTVGLDVGGTKVAGGLVTGGNELVIVRQRQTLVDGVRDPGLMVTYGLADELATEAVARGLTIDGIGAGLPEYVDPAGHLSSHEVLAWTRQPADLLSSIAPVTVESDVRCAALGEGARGAARGLESFAFVTVGTGLSYALVEDGRVRSGARGEAIALGELDVSRRIDFSATVSLERFASGDGIRARFAEATGRAVGGAADVFRLGSSGDPVADSIVRSAGAALGEGLATLVRLIDPGAVVIGGGVSLAGRPWREAVLSAYAARLSSRPTPPPILWATLGSQAGIIGAAIAHRRRNAREGP
jgi:glucokinase